MGRPEAAETKQRILTAATQLFATHGRGSTTVRAIAAAANVNLALVSHHFGGKDNLYAACVDAMYAELDGMRDEMLAAFAAGDAMADVIGKVVVRGFHYARDHRPAVKLVMRNVIDTGELPAERRDTLLVPFLDAASVALAQNTDRAPDEVRLLIQSLMYLMTRYALASTRELALVAGLSPTESEDVVLEHITQHLRRQARWLFGYGD